MNVGHPGILRTRAVNAEIVGLLAPTHRPDGIESELARICRRNLAGARFRVVEGEKLLGGVNEIMDLGFPLFDHRSAQDQNLGRNHSGKDHGENADDDDETGVDAEVTHHEYRLSIAPANLRTAG